MVRSAHLHADSQRAADNELRATTEDVKTPDSDACSLNSRRLSSDGTFECVIIVTPSSWQIRSSFLLPPRAVFVTTGS